MTHSDIEAALEAAFNQCDAALCALSDRQKQVLLQAFWQALQERSAQEDSSCSESKVKVSDSVNSEPSTTNPLNELSREEREALLEFVRQQEGQNLPWKITLLNDWLQGKDSGAVQFIRARYGVQWLEQIQPSHLAEFDSSRDEVLKLKVGDRIEVTNGLWEWVQEAGPCTREWFPCTVVSIQEIPAEVSGHSATSNKRITNCVIRFDAGAEYEIQGVYDWNRPNWRWLQL